MKSDDTIYVYDGSFDGFLSCVFEAYSENEYPSHIAKSGEVQLSIGARVKEIPTDAAKSERVYNGVKEKIGSHALESLYHATLSAEPDAETAALQFVRLGFKAGRKVYGNLDDERVWRLYKISQTVMREYMRYIEFLRFSELEGNILFGEFEPEPNILPLVMPHFTDRLSAQPFIIHDKGRKLAGIYNTREWYIASSSEMTLPAYSSSEREYRDLWKLFFDTIAVKERINPRLQMQHIPKKYWQHVTEFRK